MRLTKAVLIAAVLVMILLVGGLPSASAYYRGGGRYGSYYRGGHYGGYWGGGHYGHYYRGGYYGYWGGLGIGWPFWGPFWYGYSPFYYPYYYPYSYPTAVDVPSTPPAYIEQAQPEPSSTPPGVWYYCSKSRAYYPYVKECPGGWQTVPAQPPPAP
jgi:hypothetical protein